MNTWWHAYRFISTPAVGKNLVVFLHHLQTAVQVPDRCEPTWKLLTWDGGWFKFDYSFAGLALEAQNYDRLSSNGSRGCSSCIPICFAGPQLIDCPATWFIVLRMPQYIFRWWLVDPCGLAMSIIAVCCILSVSSFHYSWNSKVFSSIFMSSLVIAGIRRPYMTRSEALHIDVQGSSK